MIREKLLKTNECVFNLRLAAELSPIQKKLANFLLINAYNQFSLVEDNYKVQIDLVKKILCDNTCTDNFIKTCFRELVRAVVKWDTARIYRGRTNNGWCACTIISHIKIKGGFCEYSYAEPMQSVFREVIDLNHTEIKEKGVFVLYEDSFIDGDFYVDRNVADVK